MRPYWKFTLQQPGPVGDQSASLRGPGTGSVSGLPVVSCPSSQDAQAATHEQKRRESAPCRADVYQSEPRVIAREPMSSFGSRDESALGTASRGGAFVGESPYSPDPDCSCEMRDCECPHAPVASWTKDGERLVHSAEGDLIAAFRECAWCGEEMELEGAPDEDTRRYCDKSCWLSEGGKAR